MKRELSPLLKSGLLLYVIYVVMNRFLFDLPHFVAMLMLFTSVILMLLGGLRGKN